MRIVVLEDNYRQAEWIKGKLLHNFPSIDLDIIKTELEFRQRFDEIAAQPPDLVILDVIVRWTDPERDMQVPPPDISGEGYFRAGMRCERLLREDQRTEHVPVIVYTVRSRDDLGGELEPGSPRIFHLEKGGEDRLIMLIRSVLEVRAPRLTVTSTVFIVHGHNDAAKESVARFVERLGLNALVLHEQPNLGRTIVEKFERYSDVDFAVILLTPDDLGKAKSDAGDYRPRARQNVIFELGFFAAKLGRRNVCALYKPDVEIPSDYVGVMYILMDASGAWRTMLAREMKAAGLPVDANKIL